MKATVEQNSSTPIELEIGAEGTREGPYLTIDIHEASYRHRSKRTTNRVCSEEYDPDVRILEYFKITMRVQCLLPRSPSAVCGRSPSTSTSSAGNGFSSPRATRPISVPEIAHWVSGKMFHYFDRKFTRKYLTQACQRIQTTER